MKIVDEVLARLGGNPRHHIGTGRWKRYLCEEEEGEILMMFALVAKIADLIEREGGKRDKAITADLKRGVAFTNRALEGILASLDGRPLVKLAKVLDKYDVFLQTKTANPKNEEILVKTDELIDFGVMFLNRFCSCCGKSKQKEHEDCDIYQYMETYVKCHRGGVLCPYANPPEGETVAVAAKDVVDMEKAG